MLIILRCKGGMLQAGKTSNSSGINAKNGITEGGANRSWRMKKKAPEHSGAFVIPLGFEPRTHTLKVYCSTS